MKYRMTFEQEPDEQSNEVKEEARNPQTNDMWRFGEIRETLWGKGPGFVMRTDLFDFDAIRETLWGK
jgi:hypothetical protein